MKCPGCRRAVWLGTIHFGRLFHRQCGVILEAAYTHGARSMALIVRHQAGEHRLAPYPGCPFCEWT